MAIALPLIAHLFAPLHGAVEWLSGAPANDQAAFAGKAPEPEPTRIARSLASARSTIGTVRPMRAWGGPTRAPQGFAPVRTVRVLDDQLAAPSAAGRMVISGRLDDVCAELDRLVAQEVGT